MNADDDRVKANESSFNNNNRNDGHSAGKRNYIMWQVSQNANFVHS